MVQHRLGARGSRIAKSKNRDERNRDRMYDLGVLTRPGEREWSHVEAQISAAVSSETIVIDPEFQSLIPPQTPEENTALEESLLRDGCNDALVIWQGHNILIDGHHRYALCQKHGITYTTRELSFESREDVIVWMVQHQLGRRNISAFVRSELALRMKSAVEAKAKANQAHGQTAPGKNASTNVGKSVNTQTELAKAADVSKGTLHKVENVTKNAPEPIKAKARSGEISVNRADLLTKALKGASDTITEFVTTSGVDDPERVEILKRLEKSAGSPETNGTFDEIMRTGGFHFGSEEHERVKEFATAPIQQIQRGLDAIAKTHAVVAAQGREAENEAARRANALRVLQMSESNEWYTPAQYVNAARALMGSIDLDPATSAIANEVVQAAQIYTFETDGLAQNWHGNVWLNPPYGRDEGESNQAIWTARLIEQYTAGNITQAVLLVNAVTDRQWFQPLWDYPICFTNHRIKFYKPSKDAGSPTMGSVLVYFGANREGFANAFKQFGAVVMNSVRA